MADLVKIEKHTPFADDGPLVKGQLYIRIGLGHSEGFATPEQAVGFAQKLIEASGLPFAVINLSQKRDDKKE